MTTTSHRQSGGSSRNNHYHQYNMFCQPCRQQPNDEDNDSYTRSFILSDSATTTISSSSSHDDDKRKHVPSIPSRVVLKKKKKKTRKEKKKSSAASSCSSSWTSNPIKNRVRYEKIQKWLVHVPVEDHNEFCQTVFSHPPSSSSAVFSTTPTSSSASPKRWAPSSLNRLSLDGSNLSSAMSSLTDHNDLINKRICSICTERLEVGDIVSWSPNIACKHVFHHSCIMEWLVDHEECPLCAHAYLPIDSNHNHHNNKKERNWCRSPKDSVGAFYCRQHGVIQTKQQHFDDLQEEVDKAAGWGSLLEVLLLCSRCKSGNNHTGGAAKKWNHNQHHQHHHNQHRKRRKERRVVDGIDKVQRDQMEKDDGFRLRPALTLF